MTRCVQNRNRHHELVKFLRKPSPGAYLQRYSNRPDPWMSCSYCQSITVRRFAGKGYSILVRYIYTTILSLEIILVDGGRGYVGTIRSA